MGMTGSLTRDFILRTNEEMEADEDNLLHKLYMFVKPEDYPQVIEQLGLERAVERHVSKH